MPQAIFVVDSLRPGRPNRYVNAAYSALTGYDASEAVDGGFDALAIFVDPAELPSRRRSPGLGQLALNVRRRDGTAFRQG